MESVAEESWLNGFITTIRPSIKPPPQETSSGTFGWLNGAGQDLAREGEGEPALLKDYLKRRRMRSLEFPAEAAGGVSVWS